MSQDQSKISFSTIIIAIFVIGLILSALSPKKYDNKPVYTQQEKQGLEYAKTRFRQEGYSEKDAQKAAEVILKFEQAKQTK